MGAVGFSRVLRAAGHVLRHRSACFGAARVGPEVRPARYGCGCGEDQHQARSQICSQQQHYAATSRCSPGQQTTWYFSHAHPGSQLVAFSLRACARQFPRLAFTLFRSLFAAKLCSSRHSTDLLDGSITLLICCTPAPRYLHQVLHRSTCLLTPMTADFGGTMQYNDYCNQQR
jgi:hypothetical protein